MQRASSPRRPDSPRSMASNRRLASLPSLFLRPCSRSDSSAESVEYAECSPWRGKRVKHDRRTLMKTIPHLRTRGRSIDPAGRDPCKTDTCGAVTSRVSNRGTETSDDTLTPGFRNAYLALDSSRSCRLSAYSSPCPLTSAATVRMKASETSSSSGVRERRLGERAGLRLNDRRLCVRGGDRDRDRERDWLYDGLRRDRWSLLRGLRLLLRFRCGRGDRLLDLLRDPLRDGDFFATSIP